MRQPKEDSEHALCRRESVWAATAAWKVKCSQRHDLIKMSGGHAHVTKERATLNTLPVNAPYKVPSVARSSVSLATNICEVGQFRQLEKLVRFAPPYRTRPQRR